MIYLNCGEWYEDLIDHRSYAHNLSSCEIKTRKKLNGIWTHDLCDTGAMLYQLELSSQLGAGHFVSSWYSWDVDISKILYMNCRERYEDIIDHHSYSYSSSSREI